jgi:hypothetical protein
MIMKRKLPVLLILLTTGYVGTAQYTCKNWEAFLASGPELEQIGWLVTKTSKEIQSSPWSVGCETIDRDYTIFSNYKDYVGELGVKSARLQGGWAKCEKKKGKYNFEWLDSCVYGLVEQEVKPWICLCYGNPLYGSGVRLGSMLFTDEASMKAWLKWVSATVTRYSDVVNEWEIWNEANIRREEGVKAYSNLLIRTAETIKAIQPDAVIIGFALAGIPLEGTKAVLEILKEENKLGLIDYVSYHPYSYNPDDSYPRVESLRELVHQYNPEIRLFQGENAAPSDNHYVYHALRNYPWTEISQAKWYMRRMTGDRIRNIRTSVFSIIDMKYREVLLSMGLLRSNLKQEVLYRKPAYYAVQHMVTIFDDHVKPVQMAAEQKHIVIGTGPDKNVIMEYKSGASRTISLAKFEKEGTPLVLVWYNDRIPSDDFFWDLTDLTVMNTKFLDPVYVELISGKIYEIDKSTWEVRDKHTAFRDLPVWDSPVMIAERSQIEMKTME